MCVVLLLSGRRDVWDEDRHLRDQTVFTSAFKSPGQRVQESRDPPAKQAIRAEVSGSVSAHLQEIRSGLSRKMPLYF